MFETLRKRRRREPSIELTEHDAHLLRRVGLNPDDFRDSKGRRCSVLFAPFRHPLD